MNLSPEVLNLLVCPETKQTLELEASELCAKLNSDIAAGKVLNRGGVPVREACEALLVRIDRKIAYPIRNGIPVLLVEEGIPVSF